MPRMSSWAAGASDHRLYCETFDPRIGHQLPDPLEHFPRRALGFLGALEPEPDAADVRFVRDVIGKDLDHARAVLRYDTLRRAPNFRWACGNVGRHHGNAVRCKQRLPLRLRQYGSSGADRGLDRCGRLDTVERHIFRKGWGRAHQLVLRPGVAHKLHEPVDGLRWRREACDIPDGEKSARVATCCITEPSGQDRLRECTFLHYVDQCARRPLLQSPCSTPAPWGNS